MCCSVRKKLHTRLSEKYIDDAPSIIKLMLHTFTEFVSKTNLNLYNKICYKENKMLFYSKCGWVDGIKRSSQFIFYFL